MFIKGVCTTAAVVVALNLSVATQTASAQALLSHRAVYDLANGRVGQRGDADEISGRLVIEAIEECDGYILNQRIVTRLSSPEGGETVSDLRMAIWESKNGKALRFNILNYVDGRLVQEDDGHASLTHADGSGVATYTKPAELTVDLPAGTVFPMAQNLLVLKGAREGKHIVPVSVFDGSSDGGLFDTFTAIGKRHGESAEATRGMTLLRGIGFWRIRTGYFPAESKREAPEFEIGYNLFENGVAGDMTLDYGDLVIAGALKSLESIATPACTE